MAKEEGPLEYQRRSRDTKSMAQRIDLEYIRRPALLAVLRRRMVWIAMAVSLAAAVPMVLGVGGSKKALLPGPISPAHAMFQQRCEACHSQAFASVGDAACKACHDGAPHPAKIMDTARVETAPRCAECHLEHTGTPRLAVVANGNCTRCHSDLKSHATGVHLAAAVTAFRAGKHPEFSALGLPDGRPIRLNHAIHMPGKPRDIRGMKLPMQCGDCHRSDPASASGYLLPVTFEKNCRSCHARELEFDIYELLGEARGSAVPHGKDPQAIHQFLLDRYRQAIEAQPALVKKPLGTDIAPQPSAAAWLERVVSDSERFLFQRKCNYCHEYAGSNGTYPAIRSVHTIQGRYVAGKPEGESWIPRGQFSHRAHRAVDCESCHTAARGSTRTADVLIPSMKTCLPCHQQSTAALDRCSTCHLYHNRNLEKDNRRTTEQVLTGALRPTAVPMEPRP